MGKLVFLRAALGVAFLLQFETSHAKIGFPLYFQASDPSQGATVEYVAQSSSGPVRILPGALIFPPNASPSLSRRSHESIHPSGDQLRWIGSNPDALLHPSSPAKGKVNYLAGPDPKAWKIDLPTYDRVQVDQLYPGIDVIYYGNQNQLECDVIVEPGADPQAVSLNWTGSEPAQLGPNGEILLPVRSNPVRLLAPQIYQMLEGSRKRVPGAYRLSDGGSRIEFVLADYDRTRRLVIDPIVVYDQAQGGTASDYPSAIATDADGNVYVTGYTASTDFPTTSALRQSKSTPLGQPDAFVMKMDATGTSLLYATYLGGTVGQVGASIAVDADRNAWVAGWTGSADFPTVNPLTTPRGGTTDVFLVKLDATGSRLLFSTLLGGSGEDFAAGLALDPAGNAYVTGTTSSPDLPADLGYQWALGGATDAFIAKVDATGNKLHFLSYLGGPGAELASCIAVTPNGSAVLSGTTSGTGFPLAKPLQAALRGTTDVYVAEFTPDGASLRFATLLGGSLDEFSIGVEVGPRDDIWITGATSSSDFPTRHAFQPALYSGNCQLGASTIPCFDAFVTRLTSDGQNLVFSTFLGGNGLENPTAALAAILTHSRALAVDKQGFAYVTGMTTSTNFPTVNPIESALKGNSDFFLTKFHPNGNVIFSTYGGGPGNDAGTGIAANAAGDMFLLSWTERGGGTGGGGGKKSIGRSQNEVRVMRLFELPVSAADPPAPLLFGNSRLNVQGNFETLLSLSGRSRVLVETSTNLIQWTPLRSFDRP